MFTRRAALMGAAFVAAAPYVIKTANAQETAAKGRARRRNSTVIDVSKLEPNVADGLKTANSVSYVMCRTLETPFA